MTRVLHAARISNVDSEISRDLPLYIYIYIYIYIYREREREREREICLFLKYAYMTRKKFVRTNITFH